MELQEVCHPNRRNMERLREAISITESEYNEVKENFLKQI